MFKRIFVIVVCSVAWLAGIASAQENATLVTRSGERISGQLVDMGGVDFTMRVNGQEHRVRISEVAVIDFVGGGQGLPDTELSAVTGDRHIAVLRGGTSVQGRLYDISGTRPLKITFDTGSGQRDFTSTEVGRIYLARPPGAVPTPGTTPPPPPAAGPGQTIAVPANSPWVSTGITVREGDMVSFFASGEVRLSSDPNDVAGPAGAKSQRYAAGAPLPRAYAGALIGRIGRSAPFGIGDQTDPIRMPARGTLFLGVNDDDLNDNSGQFTVTVNAPSMPGRRRR